MIKMEIQNEDKLEARLKAIQSETPIAMRKAINAAALMVKSTAQDSIKKQSPGAKYRRYEPPRTGVASSPGSAPNDDRGNLVKNIIAGTGYAMATKGYEAEVRSQAPYSMDLEYGTGDMKARPFMKPALEKNRKKILAMITKAVRGLI